MKKIHIKILASIFILSIANILSTGVDICERYNDIINAPIRVIKNVCLAYIYISIAYFISKKWGNRILNIDKLSLFIIGSLLLTICFYYVNFCEHFYIICIINDMGLGGYFYNLLAGFGILFLFTAIEGFSPLSKPLVYCGRNSLTIMAIHFGILFETALIVDKYMLGYEHYYGKRTIIYFFVAVILQICINEFINKKAPFIIGK